MIASGKVDFRTAHHPQLRLRTETNQPPHPESLYICKIIVHTYIMMSRCPVMPSSFARDSEQSRRSPTCNLDGSGGVPDSELNSSPSFSSLVSMMPPQPGGSHGQCVHWQAPTGLPFCMKVQVGMSRYACPRIMHMLGCLFCSRSPCSP